MTFQRDDLDNRTILEFVSHTPYKAQLHNLARLRLLRALVIVYCIALLVFLLVAIYRFGKIYLCHIYAVNSYVTYIIYIHLILNNNV